MTTSRSLDELLALDSYQGMTDEEIARVMDFRASVARTEAQTAASVEAQRAFANDMAKRYAEQAERARADFEAACAYVPPFRTTGGA